MSGQIHPWVQLAWGVVSAAHKVNKYFECQIPGTDAFIQVVMAQNNRDMAINELVISMAESCKIINEADALGKDSTHHQGIIQRFSQLVVECAYFIRDYAKDRSFGEGRSLL